MKRLLTILFFISAKLNVDAGVDLRHGIFYITYTDVDFPGSKADLTRSYNSNNTNTGLFGYGWNSFIETKLTALPDGTLSLSWWGGGLGDYYEPAVIDRKGLYEMVNAIIKDLIKNNKLANDPVAIAEKKSYYLINNKQRAEKYIALQKNKTVPVYIPSGIQQKKWILDVNQVITWTGKTFEVKSWKDQYRFNANGQMILVNDRAYKMEIQYSNNRLSAIVVDANDTCQVKTDDKGRIIKLIMPKNGIPTEAIFRYDSSDNLLYSKDIGNNEYWFSYDLYHNLVRISYTDATSMEMTYDAASNRIIKLKDRKGAYTTYQYPYFYTAEGKINYDHYATRVKEYDSVGKLIFTRYREFENRIKEDGSTYLHRLLEQSDTLFHEVLYEPEVGNARYRKKNNREAWAAYDNKKRPSYLHINDSIYKCRYNISDMPEYFSEKDSIKNTANEYSYKYNDNNELSEVRKNNETFILQYDTTNNITTIEKMNSGMYAIRQLEDSSFILSETTLGSLQLTKKEWRLVNDIMNAENGESSGSQKSAFITGETGALNGKNLREMLDNYQAKKKKGSLGTGQLFDKSKFTTLSSSEKQTLLLGMLHDYKDILKPKKIEHEWIWERM